MHGIRVRGVGRVGRAPDSATVVLGVDVGAPTALEAQTAASTRMRAVVEAITACGIALRDIDTRQVGLSQTFDYTSASPRATGYQATQTIVVRVGDLAQLGRTIDAAVAAGANQVAEVTLGLADPAGAVAEARDLAMADARRTAEALAAAGGVHLGLPVAIREGRDPGLPGPMFKATMEMAAPAETPIAAGQTEVEVSVEVTWAILG